MLFKHARKGGYKFTDKHHSIGGIISIILACISAAVMIYAIFISYRHEGDGPYLVGILGCTALVTAVFGTISALIGFKEEDKFYILCWFGSVLNCAIWIFLGGMILSGL